MSDPASAASDEWLDRSYLAELIEIDPDDIDELLRCMIADVPGSLEKIAAAVRTGDREAARVHSHTLRGMLLNFGCPVLAERLLRFERDGWAAGAVEEPAAVLTELQAMWRSTQAALETWLAGVRKG